MGFCQNRFTALINKGVAKEIWQPRFQAVVIQTGGLACGRQLEVMWLSW